MRDGWSDRPPITDLARELIGGGIASVKISNRKNTEAFQLLCLIASLLVKNSTKVMRSG